MIDGFEVDTATLHQVADRLRQSVTAFDAATRYPPDRPDVGRTSVETSRSFDRLDDATARISGAVTGLADAVRASADAYDESDQAAREDFLRIGRDRR